MAHVSLDFARTLWLRLVAIRWYHKHGSHLDTRVVAQCHCLVLPNPSARGGAKFNVLHSFL